MERIPSFKRGHVIALSLLLLLAQRIYADCYIDLYPFTLPLVSIGFSYLDAGSITGWTSENGCLIVEDMVAPGSGYSIALDGFPLPPYVPSPEDTGWWYDNGAYLPWTPWWELAFLYMFSFNPFDQTYGATTAPIELWVLPDRSF